MAKKFKVNYVFGFKFYKLPRATQVMFFRVRTLVDKYARISYDTGVIQYSVLDGTRVRKEMDKAEAKRIFNDLYLEDGV